MVPPPRAASRFSALLLRRFEGRAGSPLEILTHYLVSRIGIERTIDDSVLEEEGMRVLLCINGVGIRRLVCAELRASSRFERSRGALLAGIAPSGETLDLLKGIAAIERGSDDRIWAESARKPSTPSSASETSLLLLQRWLAGVCRLLGAPLGCVQVCFRSQMRSCSAGSSSRPQRRIPSLLKYCLLIGFSGRTELSYRVRAYATAPDRPKDLLLACLFALGELRDSSDQALAIMARAIQDENSSLSALRALRQINSPAAVETIVSSLSSFREKRT